MPACIATRVDGFSHPDLITYFRYWCTIFEYMKVPEINNILIEGYIRMLANLSDDNKRDLIARLSKAVESKDETQSAVFFSAFGAWDAANSADEILSGIRSARTFGREIEEW